MHNSSSLGHSPSIYVEEGGGLSLSREFSLSDERPAGGVSERTQRGPKGGARVPCTGRSPPAGVGHPKRARLARDNDASAVSSSSGRKDEERLRLLQQLSQVIPAAGSLLPGEEPVKERPGVSSSRGPQSSPGESLDWEACNRALDRLVSEGKPKDNLSMDLPVAASSSSGDMGIFDIPLESRNGTLGAPKDFFDAPTDPLDSLNGTLPEAVLSVKRDGGSNAADPMKERQRRELQQRKTLDLASQIVSRFRGARKPGVLQLLRRFFSCSSRQVRDPQELEKLVGACCYIIARQQGDDMSLNDVTSQLEKRQGTKGKQRCRCISKWVVKVCGKLQLRCLPRHRDAEAIASNALRRICAHLKLLLTQQEQQELLLLQQLKEAYKQCVQQEAASTAEEGGSSRQPQANDAALAELDDEDLLRLLLLQQEEESSKAAAASPAAEEKESAAPSADGLPDVEAFLQQFDSDCKAKKSQVEAEEDWAQQACSAAEGDPLVSLAPDGSLQLRPTTAATSSPAAAGRNASSLEGSFFNSFEVPAWGGDASDPAALDAQIQQHECVLRLLRLLPSAQRIKLDHSIWLQKQRKLALQQLCEQSSLVIKCVGLLQQLTAVAFACAAAKKGSESGAVLQQAAASSSRRDTDSPSQGRTQQQPVAAEGEDPLDENWRACGRCDAISTAAHFVIVFECLQVPVFQRVVLEALQVDRRSVYKRRREQLQLTLNIFKKLPGAEDVTLKNLGPLLVKAVNDPKMTSELLQIAETEPLPASTADSLDGGVADDRLSNTSSQTSGPVTSQRASRSSREELSSSGVDSTRGSSPVGAPPVSRSRLLSLSGPPFNPIEAGEGDGISSAAAAAAALRELEEEDPVLTETPMARVVSLQYERTQQRWVCKWREGVGTGGRWHRRCFSVVKYGEDGAHTLAAAVAKKLRDKRNQETSGGKQSPTSNGAVGSLPASSSGSSKGQKAGPLGDAAHLDGACPRTSGVSSRGRSKRTAASGAAGAAASQETSSAYPVVDGRDSQAGGLLTNLPADPALSSVVASAAYSDEMERLAQLLHKARNNPLLAKWLDERAPPPGAAALRAAAESLVPYLALQTAAEDKAPGAAASASFGSQQQSLQRRGRVAGAREGM